MAIGVETVSAVVAAVVVVVGAAGAGVVAATAYEEAVYTLPCMARTKLKNTRYPGGGGVGKVARGQVRLDSFGRAWPRRISGSVFYRGILGY